VVLEKWSALLVGVAIAGAGLAVGLAIGITAFDIHIGWRAVAAATVATTMVGMLFGTTALTIGAATGNRGLARGVTAALAVLAYLVSSLSDLVTWLRPIRSVSPWYHALGVDPLTTGFQPWRLLLLAVLTALVAYGGTVAFERRDLAS